MFRVGSEAETQDTCADCLTAPLNFSGQVILIS